VAGHGLVSTFRFYAKDHSSIDTIVELGQTYLVGIAGGGRNIVRVDLTGDNGKTWGTTNITHGSEQPHGKAWAWVFWECTSIPAIVCEDGVSVQLSCKGVDKAFNTQPESSDGMWNVRGLGNNSWFRLKHRVA
jgi:sulfite oxidase